MKAMKENTKKEIIPPYIQIVFLLLQEQHLAATFKLASIRRFKKAIYDNLSKNTSLVLED